MLKKESSKRTTRILFEAGALVVLATLGATYLFKFSPRAIDTGVVETVSQPGERSSSLSVYDPERAFDGYTLYPADGNSEVWLLDMQGNISHRWKADAERARLLPNGHLLVIHGSKFGRRKKPWRDLRRTIREYNWDSEVVWEHTASDVVHHDVHRLPNGNTLFLRRTVIPGDIQSGIADENRQTSRLRGDSVIEVNSEGETVFSWHAHEHLDINSCGARGCDYLVGKPDAQDRGKDWTHMNTVSIIPDNKWYEAGDKRFRPGNFIVLPRNWWTVLLVDRPTGKVVWRYGEKLEGGHEAHMIAPNLPGAGNILIFDNGSSERENQSIIREINPTTNEVVWEYAGTGFFSRTRGSVQRLPNGNTFISEDVTGRSFEVTPDKEIVWEFKPEKFESNRSRRFARTYCNRCSEVVPES